MTIRQTLLELLESSSDKKFLFLGREGTFTQDEIARYLKRYHITATSEYEERVVGVVEHHSLNPLEEDISCMAYEQGIPLFKLHDFEKLLSSKINDDELLMALKLGNDQTRILRLLGNESLSDTLFVKLLMMYAWHEEEEDDRDDRNVIMYTLRRFIAIKPNEEDLLYSSLTLKRLARETDNPRLLEALIRFPNFTFLQKGKSKITLRESIATNPHVDKALIDRLLSLRNAGVDMYLAANTATPLEVLGKYAHRDAEEINQSLASNPRINEALFTALLDKSETVIQLLLWYQPVTLQRYRQIEKQIKNEMLFAYLGDNETIDTEVVDILLDSHNQALLVNMAGNDTLGETALERIFSRKIEETYQHLAINKATPVHLLETLYTKHGDNKDILIALAYNISTPTEILKVLYERDEFEITKGIASNASVPLEILNVLKIDTRLRNELTANKTFVASITQKLGLQ